MQEAMLAYYRMQLNCQWIQTCTGHTGIKNQLKISVPNSLTKCDRIQQRFILDTNYVVQIPTAKDWENNNTELTDDIICFTDGSTNIPTGRTGAGEVFSYPLG